MRIFRQLRYKTLGIIAFLGIETVVLLAGTVLVMAAYSPVLTTRTPTKENSYTNNNDGIHVFLLRISKEQGVQREIDLGAYYKNDPGNNSYVTFSPGANVDASYVCSYYNGYKGSLSSAAENQYLTVTISANGGGTNTYFIKRTKACDTKSGSNNQGHDSSNAFYARYQIPSNIGNVDNQTGRYKVTVSIKLHEDIPKPDTAGESDILQQRLIVNSDAGKIGPLGGNTRSFPIVADWNDRDYWQGRIEIPFGLPCTATDPRTSNIGVYDADNGTDSKFSPREVIFAVFRQPESGGSWSRVNLQSPNANAELKRNYSLDNTSGHAIRSNDGSTALAEARVTMNPAFKYKMVIVGIAPRNTIDIKIPEDTIFGDLKCGWSMKTSSSVFPDRQEPGRPVIFTHKVWNEGEFVTTDVTSKVEWGKTGKKTSPTISTDTRIFQGKDAPGDSRTTTNTFTIPASALEGDTYCQYVSAKPQSNTDSSRLDGGDACVTVVLPPPPIDKVVTVTPYVNANMPYIEPTETATFDGYVMIGNYPTIPEWGYTEVATQRPASRVTASRGANALQSEGRPASGSFTIPSQSYQCAYNPAKTCYRCPAGYEAIGSGPSKTCKYTFYYTEYRYKCSYDSTWGSWGGSPPSCKYWYTCPGGALISGTSSSSGWYYSAPTCNGWQCAYSPAIIPGSTAPACQYRCDNGAGAAARLSDGWNPDFNCYKEPSFTLTCYWKNKPAFQSTVNNANKNSKHCDNRDMDANEVGVTIGTPVTARLTVNHPGNNAWSSPPPGWGKKADGSYGVIKTWGWNNYPSRSAEATVRVVGKPTVKIRGADVIAGLPQALGNSCTLSGASLASIGGWPGPSYNASGTQFGTFASGTTTGFSSAMINRGSTTPPRTLAFANRPTLSGERYGGSFKPSECIHDHYADLPPSATPKPIGTINSSTASGAYTSTGGSLGTTIVEREHQLTIYVDGDVTITGDIRYNRVNWATTRDIPGLKLVVRGDIYVDKSVRELNGIYIAQPKNTSTGGNIYSCSNGGSRWSSSQVYSQCQNTLKVNGAFIGKKVHLLRTNGTAIRGETSEEFNYLPELWLTSWPATNSSSVEQIKYDAITGLPPIL